MLELLRQIPLFKNLTDEQLQCVPSGTEVWLESGEILFKQGDPAQYFYLVIEGAVRITRQVGKQKIILGTYMDRAPLQDVDVHEDLDNTLTILGHKLKNNNTTVKREYDRSLPRILAYGSELNQVWTNLIDNAIDALGEGGTIWVRTSRKEDSLMVEIADNGPGIPPEIQPRIFEPFFTTKSVGKGTGLGLEIAYRIVVSQHKGDIRFFSQPGDTRFQVYLPIA